MGKKTLGLATLLLFAACLSGCAILTGSGPCLGYGCPAGASGGTHNASNVTPKTGQTSVANAKNATPADSRSTAGK